MADTVKLQVDGKEITHFLEYKIDADLYTPADAFYLKLANPETDVKAGKLCELFVNDQKELTGVIDRVCRKVDKNGVTLDVEGRDLMGLLVDSYCEPPWSSVTGMTLKTLAEKLLKNIPFINRKEITYQENVVGKLKGKKTSGSGFLAGLDEPQKINQIEAGMTVFEVLKNYSLSRGMLFYCLPNGTLVFGRPMAKGEPDYTLTMKRDGKGNNVIESDFIEDISRRYSKIIVIGQQQCSNAIFSTSGNKPGTARIVRDFPFDKLYVSIDNNDNVSPAMRARLIEEKQRRESFKLEYKVGRHSQHGKNWQINKFCRVNDDVNGINKDYLIYGRTFELRKDSGPITKLRLGEPGLVA